MVRTDWYKDFFHGMALEFWSGIVPEEHTTAEVELILEQLELPENARILDIPCGNGRHAIQLAGEGFKVTALDISEQFIELARSRARAAKADINFLCCDMSEYAAHEEFDAAVCLGNSFGYLEYERLQAFLKAVCDALVPGGSFLIDATIAAECLLPSFQDHDWYEIGNMKMLLENTYDPSAGAMETHYTFVRDDGKIETRTSLHHVYTVAEIRRLLEQAGLTVCQLLGSVNGDIFELGDPQLYIVAQKL